MKPPDPRILTINGGWSSLEFAIFEAGASPRRVPEGAIDRIGVPEATWRVGRIHFLQAGRRPLGR